MTKFVTSYVNLFNHEIRMQVIEAETYLDAMKATLLKLGAIDTLDSLANYIDEEELKSYCFDIDCLVEAFEISS